ncbi:MAG: LptF/LptG family permease [Planctomycetota bacterium]
MPIGTPITLWKHTLADLWRLLLLTGSILVTVIAFSMAVQLLAAGKIGPGDVPRLMALAVVPMLQYALPFAAGFSATLAYHRMTQDLEITATSASGISYRAVLVPAIATGLALSISLAALNEQVIPRFLRGIERMVTDDAIKLMTKSFERGEAVAQDGVIIAADRVFEMEPPEGAAAYLVLERVLALETHADGRVKSEALADLAHVYHYRDRPIEGEGVMVMRLENVISDVDGESFGELDTVDLVRRLPDSFSDDPKFLTFGELRQLRHEPRKMGFIESRRRTLAVRLATREAIEAMARTLETTGRATLVDASGRAVSLRASALRWSPQDDVWRLIPSAGEPVALEWARVDLEPNAGGAAAGAGGAARFEAEEAFLRPDIGDETDLPDLTFTLDIRNYTVRNATGADAASGARTARTWPGLKPTPDPQPALLAASTQQVLTRAEPRVTGETPDPFLVSAYDDLTKRLERLSREITSKQHERMAMAVACFIMVIAGAVAAMRLGGALPLTVYLWSFFPALAAIITISSGQQVTHRTGPIGLVLLWGGVSALGLYTLVAFRGLSKN